MMIQIKQPNSTWEIVHMEWVTALPPGGNKSFNAFLVLVDGYSKATMFLTCKNNYISMDTAIILFKRVISLTGLFLNIISDRDPNFTAALWTNLHNLFCSKFLLSTDYDPQTDGLSVIMIKAL
ncbi:hypothetical protein O181_021987 [Austropuccinia psidii MF-1]|uniref:Integrase catalytic domain-containing protein n=1 Tax=Austropuccinia psidii MF-1 TaxID=1389203 RepID=A0A9Q3CEM4_9BASI|nr:hypothetical protein [Austropuccinia psidii MF-1]